MGIVEKGNGCYEERLNGCIRLGLEQKFSLSEDELGGSLALVGGCCENYLIWMSWTVGAVFLFGWNFLQKPANQMSMVIYGSARRLIETAVAADSKILNSTRKLKFLKEMKFLKLEEQSGDLYRDCHPKSIHLWKTSRVVNCLHCYNAV